MSQSIHPNRYHVVTLPPALCGMPVEYELRAPQTGMRVSSGTGPGIQLALNREAEKRNSAMSIKFGNGSQITASR